MKITGRILLIAMLLGIVGNSFAATKTLTPSGQTKLNDWAQKVARIYATALKNMSANNASGEKTVYVYAKDASGFSTSGKIVANYSNLNMTAAPGCSAGATLPAGASLPWGCPGDPRYVEFSAADHGAYNPLGYNFFKFDTYGPQEQCLVGSYGFGLCLGRTVVSATRASCIIGARRVGYKFLNNNYAYCQVGEGFLGTITSYTMLPDDKCLAASGLKTSYVPEPVSCATLSATAVLKDKLQAYRAYQAACNSNLLPAAGNVDLAELDTVLSEIENGIQLSAGDVQGDTNPPPAQNPWTAQMPKFEAGGLASQTFLVGGLLPEKLKVKVTSPDGTGPSGVQVGFSVDSAPSADWSFDSGNAGQPATLATINGTAETGFKLGTASGTYSIKATCGDCCPSEVRFSAKAISDKTRINGKIKNGQCGSLTFGERAIPVNADGTFVIDDVKLIAKEENGVTKVDYEDFLSAGACQVDVLCPEGNAFLGDPGYPGCGNGAHRNADPPAGYKKKRKKHYGVDIHGAEGFVVRAVKAGTVIHVGEFKKGDALRKESFGWIVITKTKVGNRFEYIMYAHLQAPTPEEDPLVKVPTRPGDIVNAGDPIGLMGATGNASKVGCPPHVHIEMRRSSLEIKTINNTELMPGKGRDFNSGKDTSNKFISSNVFLNTCVKWNKKGECLKRTDPKNALKSDINSDCELGCKYYGKCTQKKK